MPDLSDLDHFDEGLPPMHPLPPSEVRRRGDRLRRRNTGLVVGGGLLSAVLAVGAPVLALNGSGAGEDVQPAPSPSPTEAVTEWVTTIPDGFPLGDGMGAEGDAAHVGTERGEVVFESLAICGQEAWSLVQTAATDALGAVWSDEVEGGEQRTLATYGDDRSAGLALEALSSAVAQCPEPESRGGGVVIEPVALESSLGDDSAAWVDRYLDGSGPTGEGHVLQVVRVGNALLVDKTYIGGAGDLSVAQDTVTRLAADSADVVAEMCVFSAGGC